MKKERVVRSACKGNVQKKKRRVGSTVHIVLEYKHTHDVEKYRRTVQIRILRKRRTFREVLPLSKLSCKCSSCQFKILFEHKPVDGAGRYFLGNAPIDRKAL